MTQIPTFGARSTADHVLAGIDLTGKQFLVTGCSPGIGFETMSALAANGAHVIAAAPTLQDAARACRDAGYRCSPVECDLGDLDSVAVAAETVRRLQLPLDAIIATGGVSDIPSARVRYGVEEHFRVNHLGHFALMNDLADTLRDDTGRIVIVTGRVAGWRGGSEGIMFDNLAGQRFYQAAPFHAQSRLANALYAKELSRRLQPRGIVVNAADPGDVQAAAMDKNWSLGRRLGQLAALPFRRTPAQGAATIALLAGSPNVAGITGEYWQNCAIARANPLLDDGAMAMRLWHTSQAIIAEHRPSSRQDLAKAA